MEPESAVPDQSADTETSELLGRLSGAGLASCGLQGLSAEAMTELGRLTLDYHHRFSADDHIPEFMAPDVTKNKLRKREMEARHWFLEEIEEVLRAEGFKASNAGFNPAADPNSQYGPAVNLALVLLHAVGEQKVPGNRTPTNGHPHSVPNYLQTAFALVLVGGVGLLLYGGFWLMVAASVPAP